MMRNAVSMDWISKERLFGWLWRGAVFFLPWQTRWFSDISLAGWPWEQGRWSVYASWIVLLVTIVVGHVASAQSSLQDKQKRLRVFYIFLVLFFFLSLLATRGNVVSLRAVLQWWMQILLLIGFIGTCVRNHVSARDLVTWFVISLLPHAVLAIIQYMTQHVIGSAWFGMASQLPETRGVSVVAYDGLRILRAYGGFPHPNILGGWLAVGWLCALWLASVPPSTFPWPGTWRTEKFWIPVCLLFLSALFLTYSRAAWLAVIAGCAIFVSGRILAQRADRANRTPPLPEGVLPLAPYTPRRGWLVIVLIVSAIAVAVFAYTQRSSLSVRLLSSGNHAQERLEIKSIDARMESLRQGWQTFKRHPLIGTGPNAELVEVASRLLMLPSPAPLEPPHNVYLLFLVNTGILGGAIFAFILFQNRSLLFRIAVDPLPASLITCVVILGFFDHYPWSLWSGQALVAVVVLTAASTLGNISSEPD